MNIESIEELKKICQKERGAQEKNLQKVPRDSIWLYPHFYRKISIYFTKVFLMAHITANQVTLLEAALIVIGGLLLASGIYWYSLVGVLLLQLEMILDAVDGEIARYQQFKGKRTNASKFAGELLERNVHSIFPLIFVCISYGVYSNLQDVRVFIFSFLIYFSWTIYYVTFASVFSADMRVADELEELPFKLSRPKKVARNFFDSAVMSLLILVALIFDNLYFRGRTLYFLLLFYGITLPIGIIIFVYLRIKHESRLREDKNRLQQAH